MSLLGALPESSRSLPSGPGGSQNAPEALPERRKHSRSHSEASRSAPGAVPRSPGIFPKPFRDLPERSRSRSGASGSESLLSSRTNARKPRGAPGSETFCFVEEAVLRRQKQPALNRRFDDKSSFREGVQRQLSESTPALNLAESFFSWKPIFRELRKLALFF